MRAKVRSRQKMAQRRESTTAAVLPGADAAACEPKGLASGVMESRVGGARRVRLAACRSWRGLRSDGSSSRRRPHWRAQFEDRSPPHENRSRPDNELEVPSAVGRPGLRTHRADARNSRAPLSDLPVLSRGDLDAYDAPKTGLPRRGCKTGGRVHQAVHATHQNLLTVERPPFGGLYAINATSGWT